MFTHLRPVSVELRDTGSILWSLTVRRNQSRSFRLCQGSSGSSSWSPGSRLSPGQRPSPAASCQPSERRWRSRWRSAEPPNLTEPLSVFSFNVDFPSLQLVPPIRTYQSEQVEVTEHYCFIRNVSSMHLYFHLCVKDRKVFCFFFFSKFLLVLKFFFGRKHWKLCHFNTQQFVFLWQYVVQQSSNKVTHLKWKRRTSPKAALVVRDVVCLPRGHYLAQADRWGRPLFRLMGGLIGSACCVPAAVVLSCLKPVSGTRSLP